MANFSTSNRDYIEDLFNGTNHSGLNGAGAHLGATQSDTLTVVTPLTGSFSNTAILKPNPTFPIIFSSDTPVVPGKAPTAAATLACFVDMSANTGHSLFTLNDIGFDMRGLANTAKTILFQDTVAVLNRCVIYANSSTASTGVQGCFAVNGSSSVVTTVTANFCTIAYPLNDSAQDVITGVAGSPGPSSVRHSIILNNCWVYGCGHQSNSQNYTNHGYLDIYATDCTSISYNTDHGTVAAAGDNSGTTGRIFITGGTYINYSADDVHLDSMVGATFISVVGGQLMCSVITDSYTEGFILLPSLPLNVATVAQPVATVSFLRNEVDGYIISRSATINGLVNLNNAPASVTNVIANNIFRNSNVADGGGQAVRALTTVNSFNVDINNNTFINLRDGVGIYTLSDNLTFNFNLNNNVGLVDNLLASSRFFTIQNNSGTGTTINIQGGHNTWDGVWGDYTSVATDINETPSLGTHGGYGQYSQPSASSNTYLNGAISSVYTGAGVLGSLTGGGFDVRGRPRPVNGLISRGAFEYVNASLTNSVNASRDANSHTAMIGASLNDGMTIVAIKANAPTHSLAVNDGTFGNNNGNNGGNAMLDENGIQVLTAESSLGTGSIVEVYTSTDGKVLIDSN